LPEGERKFLAILLDAYPEPVTRQELSDATDYQRSSRDAYLQRLKARKLIVDLGGGEVKVSDVFFE
jgi:chromosome segregation and condensation protein ScpB